jgi:hypothetical protein
MLGGKYFAETMGMFGKFVKNVGKNPRKDFSQYLLRTKNPKFWLYLSFVAELFKVFGMFFFWGTLAPFCSLGSIKNVKKCPNNIIIIYGIGVSPTSFPTFLASNRVWILFGCFKTKTPISYVRLPFGKKCCPDVVDVGNLAMNSW